MSGPPDHAIRSARRAALLLLGALALLAAGCGSTVQEGTELTVYASLPLEGPQAGAGREVLAGAEQALADAGGEAAGAPVTIEALDEAGGEAQESEWRQASIAANARAATQDSTSIAYIGELEDAATRISVPVTNEAGLLQVTPGPVDREVLAEPGGNDVPEQFQTSGERTLGALAPENPPTANTRQGQEPAIGSRELGYEAMASILDSVERANDPLSRADVVAAFMAIEDRDSELGTYSVDASGAAVYQSGPLAPAG